MIWSSACRNEMYETNGSMRLYVPWKKGRHFKSIKNRTNVDLNVEIWNQLNSTCLQNAKKHVDEGTGEDL
jgi:hypothetical protein